jgi:hypothetical protein
MNYPSRGNKLQQIWCRKKVICKMGRLGKVYVPVGEAYSTMEEPCCCTLHSPGLNYLKTYPRCKTTSVRDESGRSIAKRAVVSSGLLTLELKNKSDLNKNENSS